MGAGVTVSSAPSPNLLFMKIKITGKQGCGKTTLIMRIAEVLFKAGATGIEEDCMKHTLEFNDPDNRTLAKLRGERVTPKRKVE